MLDKLKEIMQNDKKTYTIAIVILLLVGCFIAYDMLRPNVSDQRGTSNEIESNIRSTGTQLNGAGQAVTNSQQLNTRIEKSNSITESAITNSQSINRNSRSLIREGKQIVSTLPRSDEK